MKLHHFGFLHIGFLHIGFLHIGFLHIGFLTVLLLGLAACATQESTQTQPPKAASGDDIWHEYTQEDAQNAIASAESAIQRADAVGGEWRDTSPVYLKQAKDALANGIYKIAVHLAETAQFQADMGYQQAVQEKAAGPWLF